MLNYFNLFIFWLDRYVYFIMRVTLAAMVRNFHLSRKPALRQDGAKRGHRKYSKRSQKYHAEIVKEEKSYSYFPFLICKMLQRRAQMEGSFSQPSDRNEFDPKQIAPTLAMKEPPPTEVLMKGPSRFIKNSVKNDGNYMLIWEENLFGVPTQFILKSGFFIFTEGNYETRASAQVF